jgi:hypothetical protein
MNAKRKLTQIWPPCALMPPATARARFTFTTNHGAITITARADQNPRLSSSG